MAAELVSVSDFRRVERMKGTLFLMDANLKE